MSFLLRAWFVAQLLFCMTTGAFAHALQPGFLDMEALGEDVWRVTWRVPDLNGNAMPIRAQLPDTCGQRDRGLRGMAYGIGTTSALWFFLRISAF